MKPAVTISELFQYLAFWGIVWAITAVILWATQATELERHENLTHGRHWCSYCEWNPNILP